jgi:glycerol-3-phosphate cytidylyltransferase-like family protein
MTGEERVKIVKACKWVDEVLPDIPYHPTFETLDRNGIDVILHGDDLVYDENGEMSYSKFEEQGRFL